MLIDGDCGECLPTIDFPHVDLPRGEQRREQHRSSIGRRQHGFKANALSRGGGEPRPSSQAGNVVARGLGGEQEPGSRLLAECEPQMGWSAPNPRSSLLRIQLNYCSDPEVNQTLGGLRL
jgi:hypothetical protein